MRHLRIPGQNLKNLSAFKSQIGGILRGLNKFDDGDKNEALTYLQKCIKESNASTSSTKKSPRKKKPTNSNRSAIIKRNKRRQYGRCDGTRSQFKCQICNIAETTKSKMLKHLETHVGAPLSCLKCKRSFNGSVSFKWHQSHFCKQRLCDNYKFKCNQCPREFMSKRTLEGHLQGHKRNNCTYCDKVLTRRSHLIRHLLEVHSIKLERDMHKCDRCEKRYIKKRSLYYHMRQHAPDKFVCLECGHQSDTMSDSEDHKRQHDRQKHFSCPKCEEKFSRRQQYLFHLERHSQYKCITCNDTYASREKALSHKQQGHEVQGMHPTFVCPHCPSAFHRENRLFIHMRKHSGDIRVINCKYCKKAFSLPYAYYKHCITISHEKCSPDTIDIVCEDCGKHFVKKYDLRQHTYRVHNTSKQPFSCDHCSYKSLSKTNMERHCALHYKKPNQFTCEHCGRGCDTLASLKDHISYNHVEEKQFECEKCGKAFKRNAELVRHRNSHSDERPHVCTTCGKTYKRLNHLKRHEQSAHQISNVTRRIQKINTEVETAPSPTVVHLQQFPLKPEETNRKVAFLPQYGLKNENSLATLRSDSENVLLNLSGSDRNGDFDDQLVSSFDRNWVIDNEDLYKFYNDYDNQQLPEIGENGTPIGGESSLSKR